MECRQVRELLSAYADGMLEPDESQQVKAHLARCAGCASEFEALAECIRTVGALERIPAPPDFLDRLYERIEEPTFLEKIAARLFLPLRIKLPLEVAGLAAAAVLVVLIQQNVTTVLKYTDAPSAEKRAVSSTMPSPQPAEPATPPVAPVQELDEARKEAAAPALPVPAAKNMQPALHLPPAGEPADVRRDAVEHKAAEAAKPVGKTAGGFSAPAGLQNRAEKPAHPAPLPEWARLKGADFPKDKAFPVMKVEEKQVLSSSEPASKMEPSNIAPDLEVSLAPEKAAPPAPAAAAPETIRLTLRLSPLDVRPTGSKQGFSSKPAPAAPAAGAGVKMNAAVLAAAQIRSCVEEIHGAVIETRYSKERRLPESVTAEIPAAAYPILLQKLGRLGKLPHAPQPEPEQSREAVRVEIVLESP